MRYWKIILTILISIASIFFLGNLIVIFAGLATWVTIMNVTLQFLAITFGLMVLGNGK